MQGATHKVDPRPLVGLARNINKAYACILVDAQHGVINQLDSDTTALSHTYGVALAQALI